MLRALAIGFVVLELLIGLAHTGARLARAPRALAAGWPAQSELAPYRRLEPFARGREEVGLVLAGVELGTGSDADLARYRVQNAIAPARLVLERRPVSIALVGADRAEAERALRELGFGSVRVDPELDLAVVAEEPVEPAAGPPPLASGAPTWRLAAAGLAVALALRLAARRGGPASAFLVLTLAPGVLAACAAALDASPLESGAAGTLALWVLFAAALCGLARVVPALEPPGLRGATREPLGTGWRTTLVAAAVLGVAALVLRVGESVDGGWDAQAMYAMRARAIALAPGFLDPFADFPGARELHPDYPPLVPFALAGGFRLAGGTSPLVAIALQLAFAVGFAGLCLRWAIARGGAVLGLCALCLTALAPFWHDRIAGQECDVPAGALLGAAALVWLWRSPAREDGRHALACGIALALAALTKNEGLFLALFFAGAVALDALRRGAAGRATLGALAAALAPALVLLALFARIVPPNDLVEAFDPARATWARAVRVARAFARPALRPTDLRLLPPLVLPFAAALVARAARGAADRGRDGALAAEAALAATLAGMTGVYFAAYLTTPWDLDWHLGTSLVRLCAQLWPGLVVLALLLAARGLERGRPRAA